VIIVSDTSAISNLILVELIELLPKIFTTIVVPQAVSQELLANGQQHQITQFVQSANWINVHSVQNLSQVESLQKEFSLDLGEAQSIALAMQLQASRLLIDERLGRIAAKQKGLKITGILGVLLIAKQQALISEVKPWMDRLIGQANFRIHPLLYQDVLRLAGEKITLATD
jgi:uncharacterized protein